MIDLCKNYAEKRKMNQVLGFNKGLQPQNPTSLANTSKTHFLFLNC